MTPSELRGHAAACIAVADLRDALADIESLRDAGDDNDPECPHSTSAQWNTDDGIRTAVWMQGDGIATCVSYDANFDDRERVEFPIADVVGIAAFVRRHVTPNPKPGA